MRPNVRVREQYELSLDGRQVASIVVGALVLLGAVFVLGLHVGRQLAPAAPPARGENPLAALDRQPAAPEAREKEPRLSFHDALTKGPPESAPIAEARPPPRADPPAPRPAPPAAPAPRREAAAAPGRDAMSAAVAKVSTLQTAPEPPGRFAVQVGATQSEAEAQRTQRKLAAEGARVVAADVPGKGRWYRIKVGSFETRAEAERRRGELAAAGVKGFVTDGR